MSPLGGVPNMEDCSLTDRILTGSFKGHSSVLTALRDPDAISD